MIYTKKQKHVIKYGSRRWNILTGATRSGKTFVDTSYRIVNAILEGQGRAGINIICGRNYGSIERNIIMPLRENYSNIIGSIGGGSGKRKSIHIKIAGQECIIFGAGDKGRLEPLRGCSVKYAYCDEVASYDSSFFELLKSRLDRDYSKCDCTCNPDSSGHWFKKFIDDENIDKYVSHFTIDDNAFLPKAFVDNLKKEYEGTVLYDRYILGLWVNAEGLVYRLFADDKNRWLFDFKNSNYKYHSITIGVDFGQTRSKTVFIACGLYRSKNGDELHILEEHHVENHGSGIDNAQIAREHFDFYTMVSQKYNMHIAQSYCDHLQTTINDIRAYHRKNSSRHYVDKVDKASISLAEYIRHILKLLNLDKIKINRHCIKIIESLSTLLYDEKKNDDSILDNGTTDVDSYDSLRYSVSNYLIANRKYNLINI